MLVSHLRNMRSVAIAYASVKLAPATSTVCRIDGVTRRRLTGLDKHDQRNALAMMAAAECPFIRLSEADSPTESHAMSLSETARAIARAKLPAIGCGACGVLGSHMSRCPLA